MDCAPLRFTNIEIKKEAMKFSVGHFTIFSATERERLHGHNFSVQIKASSFVGVNGMAFDYGLLKKLALKICASIDEYFLLPGLSPYLRIEEVGKQVFAYFAEDTLCFLSKDIKILPVTNIVVEELARWFLGELRAQWQGSDFLRLEVFIFSGPGQGGGVVWEANSSLSSSTFSS